MTAMQSVLLVDDDCDSLSALKFVFEVHNYHVVVAEHGGAALTEVKKHLPDLVVTDMEMPEVGGIELCRRLKCLPALASVPLILVSGDQPPPDVPVVWDAFLPKPVDFYDLLATTEQLPTVRLKPATRS